MAMEQTVERKLIDLFEEAYRLYDSFDDRQEPTNSEAVQIDVRKCIGLFEDSTRLVSLTGVFSSNENFEELSTEDLKYLLLPFFLAQMNLKLCNSDRKHDVEIADIYYKDFLKRCSEYGLLEKKPTEGESQELIPSGAPRTEVEMLQRMAVGRDAKLKKYREKKELQDQIKQLKIAMSVEHIDDDVKREFYLTLLKSCILEAQDELVSCDQEKQILEHLSKNREEGARAPPPAPKPLKPIIITKDVVQKAVYGLGYPSVPTMTVDEFYEERVREGIFPDPEKSKEMSKYALQNMTEEDEKVLEEQDDFEKEQKVEADDEETLARARGMDDWKDTHRRGFGNRHNRS